MIDELRGATGRDVSRGTMDRLTEFEQLLRDEAQRQNLVAASTLHDLWRRHILDSAQLVRFERGRNSTWADIGSGAGLPGVVIACIVDGPVTLIEPRRLRADFLHRVCESLQLNARVVPVRAERAVGAFDMITARAVGQLDDLLRISAHLSTRNTVWALPKGRAAEAELAEARRSWQGVFHVEQSVTDADSKIVVATDVRAKR